jgi:hypothetical protein
MLITPERGNGFEIQPGIKSQKRRDVTQNLPALVGTLVP